MAGTVLGTTETSNTHPPKRSTELNAEKPLSKETTIKQMAQMLRQIKFIMGKNAGKETC